MNAHALKWTLTLARRRDQVGQALELAKQVAACDSGSPLWAEELTRAQHWSEALEERKRLAARDPRQPHDAAAVTTAAAHYGNLAEVAAAAQKTSHLAPTDQRARVAWADALAARGQQAAAHTVLSEGIAWTPSPHPLLDRALATHFADDPWAALRIDGRELIQDYLRTGAPYDVPAVFVLVQASNFAGDGLPNTDLDAVADGLEGFGAGGALVALVSVVAEVCWIVVVRQLTERHVRLTRET